MNWNEQRIGGKAEVIALARSKSDDLWALGHTRRLFGTRTAILHGHDGGWDWAFAVNSRLNSIGILGDGSVLAVGEQLSILFDGDRWSTIGSGLKGSRRIWGAYPACANAVADGGLLYFDGRKWRDVDLKVQGISGDWADGDCDSGGTGWIVGTSGTHSCMAVGSGTKWQEDGCGSSYLYLVYVAEGGRAFAVGGDGLWQHDGTRWIELDHERDVSRLPLAISAVGPTPILVATKLRNLQGPTSELEVLRAAGWETIRAPIAMRVRHLSRFEVDTAARVLIAQGSAVWVSSELTRS